MEDQGMASIARYIEINPSCNTLGKGIMREQQAIVPHHCSNPIWGSSLLWARSSRIAVLFQASSSWPLLEAHVLTKSRPGYAATSDKIRFPVWAGGVVRMPYCLSP